MKKNLAILGLVLMLILSVGCIGENNSTAPTPRPVTITITPRTTSAPRTTRPPSTSAPTTVPPTTTVAPPTTQAPTDAPTTTTSPTTTGAPTTTPPPTTTASKEVLFQDDFNDGDMDGWTTGGLSGSWSVVNKQLKQDSNNYDGTEGAGSGTYKSTYVTAGETSWTDYTISVDILPVDDDGIGVLFRYKNEGDYLRFLWVGHGTSKGPFMRIEKVVNGAHTVLETLTTEETRYAPSTWYTIKIDVSGNLITVYVNNELKISATDSGLFQGKIGLDAYAQVGVLFDNVVVTTAHPPTTM